MANIVNQKGAAEFLQVTPMTIKRWVRAGKLQCTKVGTKKLFFDTAHLQAMRQVINPLISKENG
jgi:excisionase family DNA binding protein